MTTSVTIEAVLLDAEDPDRATAFYTALGVAGHVAVRAGSAPTDGFRGYTLSLVTSQPGNVDSLVAVAVEHGATVLKPAAKSLWGYGAAVQAPDGSIWTFASSSKKDTGPAAPAYDDVVLLLGVADVKASKRFYVEKGLAVARSFGGKYAEFEAPAGGVKLALNPRKLLAKNAGVPAEGSGSHRVAVRGTAGTFTDPDGFGWESEPG